MNTNVVNQIKCMNQKGCLFTGLFGFSIIWIIAATIAAQLMMWVMEQTIFEATFLFPDLRWLIIISYMSIVGLPLLMMRFIINDPISNIIFQFWALINFLGVVLIPGRFLGINEATFVSFIQIIGITIYIIFFLLVIKRSKFWNHLRSKSEFLLITILISGLFSIPWVLWGALGSLLDLVLNLIVGILSGLFLTILIQQLHSELFPEKKKIEPAGRLFFGLIVLMGLIIFTTVLGQNGQQWMLVFTIPVSSWIISGLFRNEGGEQYNFLSVWFLLAIMIALPLIWFDPDELSLLIGSERGETLSWVSQTISYSVVILIVSTAITGFMRKKLEAGKSQKPFIAISIFVWVTVIFIYFFAGQPGFYGESLFVVMSEQVDLREASMIKDPIDKRNYVYQTSAKFASESQTDITNFLNKFRIEYEQYYLVNAIVVKAGPFWKLIIEQREDVDRVLVNPFLRPLPEEIPITNGDISTVNESLWNLEMIGVNRAREEFKIFGKGIIIGQADSGVDGNHPALRDQFVGSIENTDYSWYDPWYKSSFPTDISGHGTHTLGIILGKNVGIAPDARWIGCVNLGRNLGNPGYYLACMQFLFAPSPADGDAIQDGKPEFGAHIFNNSWGCPDIEGCDNLVFEQAVSALRSAGVFIVSSAGNNGYYGCESITDPLAIYRNVFSVGAIDQMGELAPFSSLGPVTVDDSGRIKPDMVAPGVDIFSSMPNASYAILSGTSMAGPHVAGTVALMWSANPSLIGQIEETEEILQKTAIEFGGMYPECVDSTIYPNNAVGFGVINTYNAVEEAIKTR
ncbi:MAG: peptidase S8 [Chloroflexi bacterium HGW-Chloroflexi-3]|nr:MAG: peptidase S8 [Chloroflexi bacterium HGW-Chloroflexi-3]